MKLFTTILFALFSCVISAQNLAERLGYAADAKLLIIHADDVGVSHSENVATIEAMENGLVNSASIMVPCPWFPEIARYAVEHSEMDFGLHLTLTSEWKHYKWGPVTLSKEVKSLVNPKGYFYAETDTLGVQGTVDAVRMELTSQIDKAYQFGIDVTHLDAHMFGAMRPKFISTYVQLGRKYKVPVLLTKDQVEFLDIPLIETDVVVDNLLFSLPEHLDGDFDDFYSDVLNNLEPGVSCLLLHAAFDDTEMNAVTKDHPDWGAKWRQADFNFFSSEKCKKLLNENDIQLVTWREIRDKIVRAD
jgi:predicted glycoside hydrolase/deacetylase ChbG (UPF0249 family)